MEQQNYFEQQSYPRLQNHTAQQSNLGLQSYPGLQSHIEQQSNLGQESYLGQQSYPEQHSYFEQQSYQGLQSHIGKKKEIHIPALVLSIIGLVFSVILPLVTFVTSSMGLTFAIVKKDSHTTIASFIMCIIALVLATVNAFWAASYIMQYL